jgi:hypothetical protein
MKIDERNSDIPFEDFDKANCFYIEKSQVYNSLIRKNKPIRTVEFILYRPINNDLMFVEAKTSFPFIKNDIDITKNIKEIAQKFMDSFQLSCAVWFGKHDCGNELPTNYNEFFQKNIKFVFVLVIKKEWRAKNLNIIKERLNKELKKEIAIWKFDILTLNEKLAKDYKLVINY